MVVLVDELSYGRIIASLIYSFDWSGVANVYSLELGAMFGSLQCLPLLKV